MRHSWLDRRQLQDVSYEAIARLVEIKGEYGVLPPQFCKAILETIDETRQLLGEMERALLLDGTLPPPCGTRFAPTTARSLPTPATRSFRCARPFGGRWFDDVTVPQQMIDDILAIPADVGAL